MTENMKADDPNQLIPYLIAEGQLLYSESVAVEPLSGVSCRTVLVRRSNGPDLVVKQARRRLQVAEKWISDPARIHIEAAAMRVLPELTPPGSVPRLLFEDHELHLLGMEAVPEPHANWKSLLLEGQLNDDHVRQFGRILAGLHSGSFEVERYRRAFADRSFFETLRIEPYYAFTAGQVPAAAAFLHALIEDCRAVQRTLVHGDFSPKNILVHRGQLVLLDHEVFHFGDGAFDVGFSLTQLLSKAGHVAGKKEAFREAARVYWETYLRYFSAGADWEKRAVRHTLACMLARVRGKSPLEYLTVEQQRNQEAWCLQGMADAPATILELIATR